MKKYLLLLFAVLQFLITGCDYFEEGETENKVSIQVSMSNLVQLPDSLIYVAWIDNDDSKLLSNYLLFAKTPDVNGNILFSSDTMKIKSLHEAQSFFVTIEEKSALDDSTFKPNNYIILSGRFSYATASAKLTTDSKSFNTAVAVFNIATPTDSLNLFNDHGVWFVDSLAQDTIVQGLKYLPALTKGWIYEGWIEVNGIPISTGRFSDPTIADLSSLYGVGNSGYPYPGEDFLINAPSGVTFPINLSNAKVYITLELASNLFMDNIPGLKIFEATVPALPQSKITYPLQNLNPSLPDGNAILSVEILK